MRKIAVPPHRFLAFHDLRMPPGWFFDAHLHPFWELLVIRAGKHTVHLENGVLEAAAGSYLLYPPGVTHKESNTMAVTLEDWYLAFEYEGAVDATSVCLGYDRNGRIAEMMTWLHAERDAYGASAETYRNTLVQAIWAEHERIQHSAPVLLAETIRRYIHAHLHEEIRLEDLAGAAGLTKYHFTRTYRRLTGLTPMQDLRRIRLEQARRLLVSTQLPLKIIAEHVGIRDEYQLSRGLKQHFGMSARTMRCGR